MNGGLLLLVVIIIVISAVVGAITQFLNRLGEMNNAPNRRAPAPRPEPPPRAEAAAARSRQPAAATQDMDRFLAEIDRLRRKNAAAQQEEPPRAAPVATPVAKPTNRPRPRVAELAETPRGGTDAQGFTAPPAAPPSPILPPMPPGGAYGTSPPSEALPVATVVTPSASTGAPATRVTRLPQRAKPVPKNNLARNLNGLLGSGQGVALAVILHEVLAPPKSKGG